MDLPLLYGDNVLYYTNNFYENCSPHIGSMNARVENINYFSVEQATKLFEELLKMDRDKYEEKTKGRKENKSN